ncbi:DegT/DnrJ/EryC1/StrS family aminotransferase [Candidatus Sumerlaeota bacterium]|nr:DegT/DnrJ/EryC1/StrS family aminotransferase [Candidatus Sumerlaeota bacterium]
MNRKINIAEIKLTEEEIEAAVRVLRSGSLRQGKECAAFEEEFAKKVGTKYAITCSSGSAALHLAYMSFLEPCDEVLVPSFSFIATASMVCMAGGKPIFCDVDSETFLIDLKDAEKKITPRTKAIAPVHLFGNPCDIDQIKAFAKKYGVIIVWDAAQAHGATYKGKDIGSFDEFVCYSFYPTKNMFVGEGGIVCTNNLEFAEKLHYMRTHGQTDKYYHTILGLNYRMTDVEAAIGREMLKRLDSMLHIRRRNAALLTEGLAEIPGITPQKLTPNTEHAWHQYGVLVDPEEFGCDKDTLLQRLQEKGIASGIAYPRGLHQQPVFKKMYGKQQLPVSEHIATRVLNLPVHHGLSVSDVEYIVDAVKECRRY